MIKVLKFASWSAPLFLILCNDIKLDFFVTMIIYIILINHKIWSVALLILIVFFDIAQCCEIGGHLRSIVLPSDAMWCNNRNRMSSWTPYPRNSRYIISRCCAIVFMGAAILEQQEQLAYKESFPTTNIHPQKSKWVTVKIILVSPASILVGEWLQRQRHIGAWPLYILFKCDVRHRLHCFVCTDTHLFNFTKGKTDLVNQRWRRTTCLQHQCYDVGCYPCFFCQYESRST